MAVGFGLAEAVPSMVEPPTVPWAHDFRDSVLKHSTEKAMYSKTRYNWLISGDVTLLAERGVEEHIRMARGTVACTPDSVINIVEINKDMHDYQVAVMKYITKNRGILKPEPWQGQIRLEGGGFDFEEQYPIWHNVKFTHGNIVNVEPTIFIDADLMGSLRTCGGPLKAMLRNQRAKFPLGTPDKGFIFTFIVRGAGDKQSNLDWVVSELITLTGGNCSLDPKKLVTVEEGTRITDAGSLKSGSWRHPVREITGPLKDVMIHSYQEGAGHMITGLIIYS